MTERASMDIFQLRRHFVQRISTNPSREQCSYRIGIIPFSRRARQGI
jgi:hypothetical protein